MGSRLKIGGPDADGPWWEIVGVVSSTQNRGLDQDPFPEVFAVHDQVGGAANQLFLLVRTEVEPQTLLTAVRDVVAGMDPDQPIYSVATIEERFSSGRCLSPRHDTVPERVRVCSLWPWPRRGSTRWSRLP